MLTPQMGNAPDLDETTWAADNGCFSNPQAFNLERYLAWLSERSQWAGRCLFATAPDVVGDAAATLERSLPALPQIRELGFRAAFVAQDGLEHLTVPWETFDCLFVGGSTAWKLSEAAYQLQHEARRRERWTHMGRVNSWRRLRAAAVSGFDSADGTYLAFGPDCNLPKLEGWLNALERQPVLSVVAGA